ncbi:hypothetical protein GGS20DRAFT_432002 [Poronia punctata]|nr:hypothetical protein GGS20DRAFT_432002 [Poronia punctata]
MDKITRSISNGSCWSNVNVALEHDYIPCGNVADGGSYACCHYGDNCLSSNACYHARFGITYIAGCTSRDFSGPACQQKGVFVNQSWVGLVRCDPDQFSWAGCPEADEIVGTNPPSPNCKCSRDTTLFQDSPTLDNIARLPQSLGGIISWFPNHEPMPVSTESPSSTLTQATTASSTDNAHTTSISPTTPAPSPIESSPSGLSTGAKVGIGVGAGFGGLGIILLVLLTLLMRKRKSKLRHKKSENPELTPLSVDNEPQSPPPQPNNGNHSVLGGFKAELPADEPPSASTMTPTATAGCNTPAGVSPMSQFQFPFQDPNKPHVLPATSSQLQNQRQYVPYRPGNHANRNRSSDASLLSSATEVPGEIPVSPRSPDIVGTETIQGHGRFPARDILAASRPEPIYEMPG